MKVDALIVKSGREIRKIKTNPIAGCLVSNDGQKGWFANLPQFFSRIQALGNKMSLVLDERFSIPLNPYAEYTEKQMQKLTNLEGEGTEVDEAGSASIAKANRQNSMNVIAWTASIVVMCITLMLLIFAILVAADKC